MVQGKKDKKRQRKGWVVHTNMATGGEGKKQMKKGCWEIPTPKERAGCGVGMVDKASTVSTRCACANVHLHVQTHTEQASC